VVAGGGKSGLWSTGICAARNLSHSFHQSFFRKNKAMGYGNYSHAAHAALTAGRTHQARTEVFRQMQCHPLMNPKGLKVRECRDSADHPDSLGVIFALDVTGSMGDIPHLLATKELPKFMKLLNACGVAHPQLMFMAIGDANSDQASL